jgi:hypothetical protein
MPRVKYKISTSSTPELAYTENESSFIPARGSLVRLPGHGENHRVTNVIHHVEQNLVEVWLRPVPVHSTPKPISKLQEILIHLGFPPNMRNKIEKLLHG